MCCGKDCNDCFDTSFIVLPKGDTGEPGINGTNGTNGNTILNGAGVPSNGLGNNGDYYIDNTNDLIYGPKTADVWGSGTSLVGADGIDGTDGGYINIYNEHPFTVYDAVDGLYQNGGNIPVPLANDGDRLILKFVCRIGVAPLTNGFGLYTFLAEAANLNDGVYLHPSSTTPTYGNSFFKLPLTESTGIIEYELTRISNLELYTTFKYHTFETSGFTTTLGPVFGYIIDTDIDLNNDYVIRPEFLLTTGGTIILEQILIDKIASV